jgi:hypothetical protein
MSRSNHLLLKEKLGERQLEVERFQARMVSVNGRIKVKDKTGYVWIRIAEMVTQAFNLNVQVRENQPVWVIYDETTHEYVVEKIDTTRLKSLPDWDGDPGLANHARAHEPGGGDPINVYTRMLVALKTYVTADNTGLTINIAPYGDFGGQNSKNLASSQPVSGLARYVLIYLDTSDNTIKAVDGTTTVDLDTVEPTKPALPDNGVASAYVRLDGDQTTIAETDIKDARAFLNANLTYILRSIIQAKGDLIVGTGAGSVAVLTVGANGTSPVADDTQSTGIRWDTVGGGVEGGVWLVHGTTITTYTTITAAVAAASAGDTLVIWPGTYSENFTFTVSLILVGIDRDTCIITSDEAATMATRANVWLDNLTIQNTGGDGAQRVALEINSNGTNEGTVIARHCNIVGDVNTSWGSRAVRTNAGAGHQLVDCDLATANADVSSTDDEALSVAGGEIEVHRCRLDGVDQDVQVYGVAGAKATLFDTILANNLAAVTSPGVLAGEALDTNGVRRYLADLTPADGDVPKWSAANARWEPGASGGDIAATTHAATSKATPVDADELPLVDSAASWGLKKLTWANLKATLKSYFDTVYTLMTSANRPGVTKLYRADNDSAYNVQVTWDGSRWLLRGYNGEVYHAPCRVDYADNVVTHNAASAGVHGLPAAVHVMGHRAGAGRYAQHSATAINNSGSGYGTMYVGVTTSLTFPVAFSTPPVVVASAQDRIGGLVGIANISTTGFDARAHSGATTGTTTVGWIAIGT